MNISIQGLYSVLEEDEEHWDESGSHELNRKLSNELSPISTTISIQLKLYNLVTKANGVTWRFWNSLWVERGKTVFYIGHSFWAYFQ